MVDDDPFLDTVESSQSEIDALGLFSSSSSFSIHDDNDNDNDSSEFNSDVQEELDDSTFIESLFSDKVYDRESLEDYLSLLLQSSLSFVFLSFHLPQVLLNLTSRTQIQRDHKLCRRGVEPEHQLLANQGRGLE